MKNLPILLFLLTLSFGMSCLYGFKDNQPNPIMLQYNNDDYAAAWKTIDSLDAEGLPKSAQEKVEALYKRAVEDQNPSQIIKTVIYRGKYINVLEEEGLVKSINLLQTELETAQFPTKPILHSMLAETYYRYLNNNYWRLRGRTAGPATASTDIATWSIQQLAEASMKQFQLSITDRESRQVSLGDFTAITHPERNAAGLRPFLFDFLVHRAIDYFSNERSYLTEPAYKFYIDDPVALADAAIFAAHNFTTKDESSTKYQTLILLQELVNSHSNGAYPAALE